MKTKNLITFTIAFIILLITITSATAIVSNLLYSGNITASQDGNYDLSYYDGHVYALGVNTDAIQKYLIENNTLTYISQVNFSLPSFSSGYAMCFDGTYYFIGEYQTSRKIYQLDITGSFTGLNWSYQPELRIIRSLYCDGTSIYASGSNIGQDAGVWEFDYDGNYTGFNFLVNVYDQPLGLEFYNDKFYTWDITNDLIEYSEFGIEEDKINLSEQRPYTSSYGLAYDGTTFYTISAITDPDHIMFWRTEDFNESGDPTANYTQFELELSDVIETKVNIVAMDYDNDDEYAVFGAFVGNSAEGSVIGIVDLQLPDVFSFERTLTTSNLTYTAIDVDDNNVYTVGGDQINVYHHIYSSLSILSDEVTSYIDDAGVFFDVTAVDDYTTPDDHYFVACFKNEITELYYLKSYELRTHNSIVESDELIVDECYALAYKDGYVYYDMGDDGVGIANYTNSALTFVNSTPSRTRHINFGRHDIIEPNTNTLLSDVDSTTSILINITDKTNITTSGYETCTLPNGEVIMSTAIITSTTSFLSSSNNGDIYYCDYSTGDNVLVYDNPYGVSFKDMNILTEANIVYVYAYTDTELLVLTFKDLDVDNNMPSFFSGTPNVAYIPNLNPIRLGGDPLGLDDPIVIPYPLNCDDWAYECSIDAEGDEILFSVDPDYDGSLTYPEWFNTEAYSVTYENAGNYTMRIYLTDDVHAGLYTVHRDFNIEVRSNATLLGENESTLRFRTYDKNTGSILNGVFVSVAGGGAGYTSATGRYAEIIDAGTYIVTFSKNNYFTFASTYGTSPLEQTVSLSPTSDPDRRTLQITVKYPNGSVAPNVFIQLQMPNIVQFDFAYTDANGQATFYPEDSSVVVVIDADGYVLSSTELFIPVGTTIYRTVTLGIDNSVLIHDLIDGGGYSLTGCQDIIRGVIMCDYDKVTNCTVDAECITGSCAMSGHCSNFNWNLCDDDNMERGDRCIIKHVSKGILRGFTNWILANFLYVMIIVLILLALLVFAIKNK